MQPHQLRLLGVDFSSAPTAKKPIVVAEGQLAGAVLRLKGLRALPRMTDFEALLAERSLAHERLVRAELELKPTESVGPEMLKLWLQEARKRHQVQDDPDQLLALIQRHGLGGGPAAWARDPLVLAALQAAIDEVKAGIERVVDGLVRRYRARAASSA